MHTGQSLARLEFTPKREALFVPASRLVAALTLRGASPDSTPIGVHCTRTRVDEGQRYAALWCRSFRMSRDTSRSLDLFCVHSVQQADSRMFLKHHIESS